jgi:hypothetical protein
MQTLSRALTLLLIFMICAVPSFAAGPSLWSLKVIEMPTDWEAIRMNTATGQAWAVRSGKWVSLSEQAEFPAKGEAGTYECHATYGSESKTWYALRFNVTTGQCWQLNGTEWRPIAD